MPEHPDVAKGIDPPEQDNKMPIKEPTSLGSRSPHTTTHEHALRPLWALGMREGTPSPTTHATAYQPNQPDRRTNTWSFGGDDHLLPQHLR